MNEQIINKLTSDGLTTDPAVDSIEPKAKSGRSTQQALRERNKRTKRVSLRNQRSLEFDMDPRFHYREVIDQKGRIEKHILAGYELVEKPDKQKEGRSKDPSNIGKYRNRVVGTGDHGHELRGFMMRIPKEWYEIDQKEKQEYLDKHRDPCKQRIDGVSAKNTRGDIVVTTTRS